MCGSPGWLSRVWAQWSAPSAAPPSVAPRIGGSPCWGRTQPSLPQRRTFSWRIAVLVQAGADRDHQQVVLVEVVGVVAETLQGLHDGDDHRVRGEYAAVDEREPVELV